MCHISYLTFHNVYKRRHYGCNYLRVHNVYEQRYYGCKVLVKVSIL
jgi:hypothetical protein